MGVRAAQGKYDPLYAYLKKEERVLIRLKFEEIEQLLQCKLPKSAYKYQGWWGNTKSGAYVQSAAWLEAGYRVEVVRFGEYVEFESAAEPFLTKKRSKALILQKALQQENREQHESELKKN